MLLVDMLGMRKKAEMRVKERERELRDWDSSTRNFIYHLFGSFFLLFVYTGLLLDSLQE